MKCMTCSPLAIARRHVLGDLYSRCDRIESIPVYLNSTGGEVLGHVDEGLGHYADAFLFHLSEELCKKLSSGHFTYSFEYEYLGSKEEGGGRRRIVLSSILLSGRPAYAKPLPRGAAKAAMAEAALAEASAE
ncbi:MAG: hypothetical protein ACT4O9_00240 [Blastocatellia bacterium]